MKQVTFPVSRLTLAMIRHRYGDGVVKLHTNDIRRREMMNVGAPDKHLERKQYSLNASVTLLVNRHEYDHLSGRVGEVGFFWYAQDKLKISRFVWARVTAGLPALQAIYDYYDLHGIEEDDFAIETAERLWKRWRVEKEKERHTHTPECVPLPCDVLLSDRQAENVIKTVTSFMDRDIVEHDPRYRNGVACFVWGYLTPKSFQETGHMMKRPKSDVGKSARRFRDYLQYNDELRKILSFAVSSTEARPTPSAAS